MKTKIFLSAIGLIIAGNLSAQDPGQEYTDRMNYIFQQTNKSRIATGLLSDYGLQMVEPAYFNGVPADSNYVDMDTWKMLYSGIYTSKINNNISLTLPETVFSQIDNATHTTAVPVAMMHYQYNQLNENAVNLGLLQVVNDQIIDVPGATPVSDTKLYNQSGTLVRSLSATGVQIQLNVADLPAGIYYLHVGKKTPEIKTTIVNR
jgi:hypothetical protein